MKYSKINSNAKKVEAGSLMIKPVETFILYVEVEGTAPLIQNAFNSKSIEQMLRKHMGIAVVREKKKPRELIEDAKLKNVRGEVCVSTVSFKKAMLGVAADIKGLKKTNLRRSIYVIGHGIPISYSECEPRMDMVRLAGIGRTPDVRFRPQFNDWKARLAIEYSDQLQPQTVLELLARAGRSGVGEWRPERDGTFGTFRVSRAITDTTEASEVVEASMVPLVTPQIPKWALDADVDMDLIKKVMEESHADTTDTRGEETGT